MLPVSALLLSLSAMSFVAAGGGWRVRLLGALALGLSCVACTLAWGKAIGPLVQLVLAMTVASVLVLVLPVKQHYAKPLALACAGLGLAALLGARWLA
jgi:hypothetical protein